MPVADRCVSASMVRVLSTSVSPMRSMATSTGAPLDTAFLPMVIAVHIVSTVSMPLPFTPTHCQGSGVYSGCVGFTSKRSMIFGVDAIASAAVWYCAVSNAPEKLGHHVGEGGVEVWLRMLMPQSEHRHRQTVAAVAQQAVLRRRLRGQRLPCHRPRHSPRPSCIGHRIR